MERPCSTLRNAFRNSGFASRSGQQEQLNGGMNPLSRVKHFAAPAVLHILSDFCRTPTVPVVYVNSDPVGFDRCSQVLRSVRLDHPSVARWFSHRSPDDISFRTAVGIAAHGSVVFLIGPGWRHEGRPDRVRLYVSGECTNVTFRVPGQLALPLP